MLVAIEMEMGMSDGEDESISEGREKGRRPGV